MPGFDPQPRKGYLKTQKQVHGRHLFGVFPAQYPKEILWAFHILPVEIWDPPLEITSANAHLQPYICSVVKLGLELILQGKCEDMDGFLFPHTCDSIQNLASIVHDFLGLGKPCYFFYHPADGLDGHGSIRQVHKRFSFEVELEYLFIRRNKNR